MHQSTLIKFLDKAHRPRMGETRRRPEKHTQPGLIVLYSLLLLSLLIFSASPVSAADTLPNLAANPNPFNKASPVNNATNVPINPTLSWNNSLGTLDFQYCIDTSLNSTCDGVGDENWISTGLINSVDLTELTNDLTYEWQVRAHNLDGDTYANNSVWWKFTTVVESPGAFGKISPTDDSYDQATTLTLSWETSSGATSYEYCYDSNVNNKCQTWHSTTNTSAEISGLTNNYNYEWQVRAVNSNSVMTYANSDTYWQFTTIVAPPGTFGKINPGTEAINQPDELSLTWSASARATSYEYCYYDTALYSSCPGDTWTNTGLALTASIEDLVYEHVYAWQVRAKNTNPEITYADASTWWTFTIQAAPGAFTKYIPHVYSIDQPTTLVLSWSAWSGGGTILNYEYCLDSVIDQTCGTAGNGTWTNNALLTSDQVDLAYGTEYEWQVLVHVDASTHYTNAGETPEWWTFTTVVAPPGAFSKTNPGDGALNQSLNLTLAWSESSGATSYLYCIDTTTIADTCNSAWISVNDPIIDGTVTVGIAGLAYNTNYEWHVKAINNNPTETLADGDDWFNFSTVISPPGNFLKIGPADVETNQPIDPTLSWGTSGSATSYEFCYDADIDQTCGYNNDGTWTSTGATLSASLTGLTNGIEYEWQVRAKNTNPNPTYADSDTWWTFTTVIAVPGDFTKVSPELYASDLLPSSVTLQWEASAGAESYWYCVDSNLSPGHVGVCDGSWIYNNTSTSTSLTGLSFGTAYEWQIRADNANPVKTYANTGIWWTFTTVVAQPGSFNKTSPTNYAVNRPINLLLDWNTSSGAAEYQYCIDATLNSTCDGGELSWKTTGTDTEVSPPDLTNGTQYEWQVRAVNANPTNTYATGGTWWTFTTIVAPPAAFNKISPESGSIDLLPSSITLQWTASAGATSYWYCIDSTPDFTCTGSWFTTNNYTSVNITDLEFNAIYDWQVRAENANSTKTYANGGQVWQFSTRVGVLPGGFSKQFPLDTSIDQPTNPTLQWTAASNATRYEYCLILATGNCTTWVDNGTSRQVTISGLALNKQYKWQVRAWNDTYGPTYANSATYWTFTTVTIEPPGSFGKTSPTSGSTGQPLSLTLSWGASANVTTYEYCYDATRDSSCSSEWKSTTSTSVAISGLTYGGLYEWQVRAFRNGNPNPTFADNGTWWNFATTVAQPGAFNKSEPVNAAVDRPTALTLTWGTSTGASSYEYCYEVYDGNDTCAGSWLPAATNSANISGLNYATTYGWQVRASNTNPTKTYANAGAWHQFTTIVAPPAAFSKSSPANGAINQPLSTVLSWNPSSGATGYAYCYDATVDSSCSGTWTATTSTSANISGLSYGVVYQWQVRATNASGTTYANAGTLWTFTALPVPPGAFNKTAPAKGATTQPINPTLTWGASSGATSYDYCIDTTLDSVCDGGAWIPTAGLTASPTGLTYLTTYQWQARAKNANPNPTEANSGTWWLFTTMVAPPGPFDKQSPGHLAPNQPTRQYLSWTPSSGATAYQYCLDTTLDQACTSPATWSDPTGLLYAIVDNPELTYGATYEWQVMAVNGTGTTDADDGEANEWRTFTVKDEPVNSKANPSHEAINQPISIKLTWTNVTGALWYEYCIDSDLGGLDAGVCNATWTKPPTNDLDTYVYPSGLSNGTPYEWQVRAAMSLTPDDYIYANTLETPEWWTFTTVESVPDPFSKSAPSNSATPVRRANGLTLSWDANAGATGYRYCLDTSINDTCNTSWVAVGAGTTSVVVSNLEYNKIYQWQVLASNNNPEMTAANGGTWWTFTTTIAPPDAFAKLSPGDQALDQPINLSLSWQGAVGTSRYEYCIDATIDSACTSPATWTITTIPPLNGVSLTGLDNNTLYEWQVRAYSANPDEPTYANGGNWYLFTIVVAAPQAFSKTGPTNAVIDQPTSLMISWAASAGATGYEYCVDDNPGNSSCDDDWIETSSTQAIITGLINKTQYQWQVRAINANPVMLESDSGTWFTFSTMPLYLYLPYTASLGLSTPVLNPVTIGPGVNTYTLTWNAVAGATKYKIYESLSDSFTTYVTYETTSTSLTLPDTLVNPTRYYYHVVAANSLSSGSPSNIVAVDRQYELEDNDSSTTANGQLFFNVTYYFRPDDLKDFFKIYVPGPGTITVTVTGYPLSPLWDGQLQLFEDNTGQLRSWDVRPDLNGMVATWTGTQANWYYILIGTDSASWSSDWYTFKVTYTP